MPKYLWFCVSTFHSIKILNVFRVNSCSFVGIVAVAAATTIIATAAAFILNWTLCTLTQLFLATKPVFCATIFLNRMNTFTQNAAHRIGHNNILACWPALCLAKSKSHRLCPTGGQLTIYLCISNLKLHMNQQIGFGSQSIKWPAHTFTQTHTRRIESTIQPMHLSHKLFPWCHKSISKCFGGFLSYFLPTYIYLHIQILRAIERKKYPSQLENNGLKRNHLLSYFPFCCFLCFDFALFFPAHPLFHINGCIFLAKKLLRPMNKSYFNQFGSDLDFFTVSNQK